MKTKILFLGITFLVSCQLLMAQSMSDEQIVSYAQERYASGSDTRTIASELLAKGATRAQIKRLSGSFVSAPSSPTASTKNDIDRERKNNGEIVPDLSGEVAETHGGREIFGHDIFRSKNLSFEPNMSMAVASSYELGPGDELIIDVYGASQTTNKLKIAPDGSANIPRIGPVNVAGLTVEQAQNKVRGAMGMHYQNSTIKVSVGQTRTISISVMGEVKTPGTYTLSAFATVFHALYMAGGINSVGTLRDVKVARNGKIISTVDVYEYILNGRLAGDVKLRDNDVIIVGSYINLVKVEGKVKRPMWYEMKKNESLQSLFRFCSGFTGDAYTKDVTVNRRAGEKLSVYTVNEFDFTSFALSDEDAVIVKSNEDRYSNMVRISGAVKRPGMFELNAVKSVRGLIETAGGLQENAQKNRAVLVRLNEDRTHKTITIDLAGILNGTEADIPLENEDAIEIASMAAINSQRKMSIEGEVWKPGTFDFSENTTIEDLITMAGGLKESASLLNVEVARRIIDPSAETDSDVRSETFTYELSEGLAANESSSFVLQPYDRVFVRRSPVYEIQHTVNISGEVMFAGNYTLKHSNVRLSEVIANAGGLKKKASAHNARLIRKMNEAEYAREKQLMELAKNAADSIEIDSLIRGEYAVAIDLEKAMEQPGSKYDIILRDNDKIIIPQVFNTVKISGEVLYPNNVTYLDGKNAKYYINEAGGYTKQSLKRRAYIVYANGHVSKLSKGKIEPGCEIVVPMKEQKINNGEATKWISITASIITTAAILINALK